MNISKHRKKTVTQESANMRNILEIFVYCNAWSFINIILANLRECLKNTVCWDVILCSVIDVYGRFGGTLCLHV
jgi:hypothetical protein